jgi:hypothetical protein
MRDATAGRGAGGFFSAESGSDASGPSTAHRAPFTADGARWDETHRRWTVWLSNELIDAINAAVAAGGTSRAAIVEAALRADPAIAAHLT